MQPESPGRARSGDDFGTAWSPDGTKISFVRDLRAIGGSDRPVMVMDADGSHVHRLTATLGLDAVPALAAEGTAQGALIAAIPRRVSHPSPGPGPRSGRLPVPRAAARPRR